MDGAQGSLSHAVLTPPETCIRGIYGAAPEGNVRVSFRTDLKEAAKHKDLLNLDAGHRR
jgi:hypothetical protein